MYHKIGRTTNEIILHKFKNLCGKILDKLDLQVYQLKIPSLTPKVKNKFGILGYRYRSCSRPWALDAPRISVSRLDLARALMVHSKLHHVMWRKVGNLMSLGVGFGTKVPVLLNNFVLVMKRAQIEGKTYSRIINFFSSGSPSPNPGSVG